MGASEAPGRDAAVSGCGDARGDGARTDGARRDGARRFDARRLERVFARSFARRWRTQLLGGAAEPLYRPAARAGDYHAVCYRLDYFASALHEVAHWCIAGQQRRRLPDYGYWYAPDGRSPQQQRAFERVEAGPQALEWWFSQACGYLFTISVDNLDSAATVADTGPFRQRVLDHARYWQSTALPPRARLFFDGLRVEFGTQAHATLPDFCAADLV